MDLIHAVDEFHNTLPAHIGVVVGIVQFGDSDGVANLDTLIEPVLIDARYPSPLYEDILQTGVAV